MRLWIGIVTFVAGMVLLASTRREGVTLPAWAPRLAVAVTALGLGTLASTQPGVRWSVSSIAFSLIAIILLLSVIRDNLRR